MKPRRGLKIFCLLILLFILTFFLAQDFSFAQRLTGVITGIVADQEGEALPGVTVEITSPSLIGGPRSCLTSEKGVFHFIHLPPGTYKIICRLEGFQTVEKENLKVTVGTTVTENILLKQAPLIESLTITAEAPMVDVTRSGMTAHFGKDQFEKLPAGRETFFDIIKQTPGLVTLRNPYYGGVESNFFSAFGSNSEENVWCMDGVDMRYPELGVTLFMQPADMFEEAEVLGIGARAENGNFTGAVINVVTKSGGNSFSGSLAYYGQFDKLTADNNPDVSKWSSFHRDKFYDVVLTLGGPIIKDKIWFFGLFQKYKNSLSRWQDNPDPGYFTAFRRDEQFFKLSSQVSIRHKLVLSFNREMRYWGVAPDPFNRPETILGESVWSYSWNAQYTFMMSNNTLFEFKYSGWYSPEESMPSYGGDIDSPVRYDLVTGISSNGPWWPWKYRATRQQANATVTHYAEDFLAGDHDFKFGVQLNRGTVDAWGGYGGSRLYYDYAGAPYLLYERNITRYGGEIQNIGAFLDDSWKINERLVINLGLRFDHHDASIPALPLMDGWTETSQMGKSIEDLIVWSSISPRIGLTYQLTPDRKTLFKASYGRYYTYPYMANWEWPGPNFSDLYAYWWNGTEWELWLTVPGEMGYTVDSSLKQPFNNQFSIGLEREIFGDFSARATFVYKEQKSSIGYKNIAGIYEKVQRTSPDNGRTYEVYNQLNPEENDYLLTNPEGWGQTYKGLILNFNKRYSHNWMLNASLTWSKSEGINLSSYHPLWDFTLAWVTGQIGTDPNHLVNAKGPLNHDRRWIFKLSAAYNFPWDILASINFLFQSGNPRLTYVRIFNLNQTPFSFIRIIADKRGNERFESLALLDLRLQKTFNIHEFIKVNAFVDIFNLSNSRKYFGYRSYNLWEESYDVPSDMPWPRRVQLGIKIEF